MKPRNIILITTDQQKADAIGLVDGTYCTPNLDELVRKGVRFTHHICTAAQCTPARATWMTGRYPHEVGVNQIGHMLDPNDENIAHVFDRNGYDTVYFGKWHLGGKPADYGFAVTDYRTDGLDLWGANEYPTYWSHWDAITTAQTVNFLDDYEGRDPFFMHVSWYMPHPNHPESKEKGPFEPVDAFEDKFLHEDMPVPASYYEDDLSTKPPHQRLRSETGESRITESQVREDAVRYRRLIALMDRNLGKILEKLREKDMLDHTMIVFTSDHGDLQGAHRMRLKGVVPYKELYNVPLIVYVPWLPSKRNHIDDLNSSASLAGSLLEAVNIPLPKNYYNSLLHLWKKDELDREAYVFIEHYKAYWGEHPFRGIQTEQYKYVYYYNEDLEEMYDLLRDPDELANISGDPHFQTAKNALRKKVDEWWTRTGGLSKQPIIDETSNWGI